MKYPKPKILLVDLPSSVTDKLKANGFNVTLGSFGQPYKVTKSSKYAQVIASGDLPNYTEQEIVVVDLLYKEVAPAPDAEPRVPKEERDFWAKCNQGVIDPRPIAAIMARDAFNRTYSAGGVFVIFADARAGSDMRLGHIDGYAGLVLDQEIPDVWWFISELGGLDVRGDHGHEMFVKTDSILAQLVYEHLAGGEFLCTLKRGYQSDKSWRPLVYNKFGDVVGMSLIQEKRGSLIVLPQLANKEEFLTKLFTGVLPELVPHLFPGIEKGKWTHHPEYELQRVIELKSQQVAVEQRAKAEIAALEAELEKERAANGWLHDLLTGTGDQLVDAVKAALAVLGFQKVVDVDEERDKEGKTRREDLQIHDQSPLLIVDVKGIGGFPSDEDVLQAAKHALIRMREMGRTDINGLSVINHQRHIPPLDRENAMPFRQELIEASTQQGIGLMTAWDLYRLVINCRKLGWTPADVLPVFYRTGRIEIVPGHYQYIGRIAKAWTDKLGVDIDKGVLKVGDRIAVEFQSEFEEAPVDSIFVQDKKVPQADEGDPAGLRWPANNSKPREGLRVFRVL